MRKDIITMYASGMPLATIGEIVQSTNYQGFPVIKSESDATIIGFVPKNELRYAFGETIECSYCSPANDFRQSSTDAKPLAKCNLHLPLFERVDREVYYTHPTSRHSYSAAAHRIIEIAEPQDGTITSRERCRS